MTTALCIFSLTYLAIATQRIHKTIIALFGAVLMIAFDVLSQEEAFYSRDYGVDYNVIFLLVGMMVIINITRTSGLFEWLAVWIAQAADARPFPMLALLTIATAVISAFLNNVTTVLLIAPVTIDIARRLELNPIPYLVAEAMASNIGGAATLIGDPTTLMIGSKGSFTFVSFLVNMAPLVILVLAGLVGGLWLTIGRHLTVNQDLRASVLQLDAWRSVRDPRLLKQSCWLLTLVVLGFAFTGPLKMEPATIALLGASLFMLVGYRQNQIAGDTSIDSLTQVEWSTIFFFIGLFILVGGVVKVGAVRWIADHLVTVSGGNLPLMTLTLLWGSGFVSSVVDNIPYVATMIPLIVHVARAAHPDVTDYAALVQHADVLPLWWALAAGGCFGGNGTLVGASANVLVVDIARRAGITISFRQFLAYGLPVMVGSLSISTLYLWLRFFAFR